MPSQRFTENTVWITGASSGIGEALAKAFCREGARVIISARRSAELDRVRQSSSHPDRIATLPLDLCEFKGLPNKVVEAEQFFGPIDIMVHNGGISQRSLVAETDLEVDRRIMDTNYIGTVALTKALLPGMLAQRCGRFVVISSLAGYCGTPLRSAYCASKHALHGFFESMRAELHSRGIQVTMVCPGFIHTNVSFNALGADGTPHGKMDPGQASGMDQDECARKILDGIAQGKAELLVGGKEVLGTYVRRFTPSLFRRMVRNATIT